MLARGRRVALNVANVVARRVRDGALAHSGDLERSIRSIMNTDSGDHEHPLALA
jgi:hypothetical protein